MIPRLSIFVVLGLSVTAAVAGRCQAQRLPFRNYVVADGLPNEISRCVLQDERGYVWFGTESGATRFDGVEFAAFDQRRGLAGDWVNDMVRDAAGRLWFACGSAGVSRLDGDRFAHVAAPGENFTAICLLVDHEGRIWVGGNGIRRYEKGAFHPVEALAPPAGNVFALFEDDRQRLWVGTDQGWAVYRNVGATWESVGHGGTYWVCSFAQDLSGTVWMGSNAGLQVFAPGSDAPTAPPVNLAGVADTWIRSLFVDAQGALWIGTNGYGVARRAPDGTVRQFDLSNGLVGNNVLGITQDHEGNHWFATTTGVSKLTSLQVETWSVQDGLVHNSVMCLVEDAPGDFWVGTVQGVSHLVHGTFVSVGDDFGMGDTFTLFSLRDRGGDLWLGSELGLSRLVDGRFVTLGAEQGWWTSPSTWNRGRSLWEDERGWIWVANDRGLGVYKEGRFHQLDWPGRPDDLGCAVVVDRSGAVWLGFHSGPGIFRFEVQDVGADAPPTLRLLEHYEAPGDLPDGRVVSSELDRDGNVWFGTRAAGALRFVLDGAVVRRMDHFSTANGLVDNYVRCIMQDSRGTMWFGSNRGVQYMPAQVEGRTPFRQLGTEDGLPGSIVQFCYEDRAGAIWLCTSNGIVRTRAGEGPGRLVSPRVYISGFSVLGEADSTALGALRADLPHPHNSVSFEFVGITYKSERRPLFRYRLDGLEAAWSAPTTSRRVNYPHLPAGHYEFQVAAQNSDGLWSDTPAVFALDVGAPFWRSWWFVCLALLVSGAAVYAVHHARLRRAVEVERLRGRIAADLHDDLGSTLSSIAILSDIAMQSVGERETQSRTLLSRIRRDARQMMEAMDDIVWAIRPQADRFETIVSRMRQVGSEMLEPSGVAFELCVAGESGSTAGNIDGTALASVHLPMETRRDMFLIFKEAIANVARHARCRSARAELQVRGRLLRLVIEDDGRGIPSDTDDGATVVDRTVRDSASDPGRDRGGDGLGNMRRRAANAGGSLIIEGRPGGGTRIVLELPLSRRG